jgi:hypothetical protein
MGTRPAQAVRFQRRNNEAGELQVHTQHLH